ncbi:MAG: prepilin-type N-terminal cleavage/methylation domain-containing protein [Lachnospiraceae bacterium]|jgi:prepilin-type N-terminal cleavage/methylation domain-containing protein|nr:prepilin-type N-terminal cleavage/methylation domain-containing protein [Lachnospiraceae bacterium]
MKKRSTRAPIQTNAGFTLVEVMVCVFVLAVFCIPLLRGFNLSALNNQRAHHTQMATTYAQQTLEQVLAARLDTVDYGAPAGSVDELMAQFADLLTIDAANADISASPDITDPDPALQIAVAGESGDSFLGAKQRHLFTVLTFEETGIEVGGREYTVTVEIDPTPFSQPDSSVDPAKRYVDTSSPAEAYNANILQIAPINNIGAEFPNVNSICNVNDGSAVENLRIALGLAENDANRQAIYSNMQKEIIVTINYVAASATGPTPNGEEHCGQINVTCDVVYSVTHGGVYKEWVPGTPSNFIGRYDLVRSANGQYWTSGGKVYIFAKAYREPASPYDTISYLGAGNFGGDGGNFVSINDNTNTGQTTYPLDVYLVREYYQALSTYLDSDQFRQVNVNGTPYYTYNGTAVVSSNPMNGAHVFGETNFHTNIKATSFVSGGLRLDMPPDMSVVGEAEPRLRNYQVTVTMTNAAGEVVARVSSSKRVI